MARTMAQRLAARMYYYCAIANAGYSQPNRRRIYDLWGRTDPGAVAEGDCSMAALAAAQEAGLPTGAASYTGDMRAALEAEGWQVLPYALCGGDPDNLYTGDFLLKPGHVAVYLGENRLGEFWIDGQGDIGGSAWGDGEGDDTGGESRVISFAGHPYTQGGAWEYIIRPPDDPEDPTTSASTPEGAGSTPAPTPEPPSIEPEDTMHLIKTTTPWVATAYALVHDSLGGARAVDNSDGGELNAYIRMCGEPRWVEWDWYQLLVRRSWEMHNWLVGLIAGSVKVDIDEAVAKIINATRPEGR